MFIRPVITTFSFIREKAPWQFPRFFVIRDAFATEPLS